MDLHKVESLVSELIYGTKYQIYEISLVKEFGFTILRIAIDSIDAITVDELAALNEKISLKLDETEVSLNEYLLEVCSAGAEKELRDKVSIINSIGKYVTVKAKDMVYQGELLSFNEDILTVKINLKGRFKNINIPYNEVIKINLSVRF